jgi:hypothetical protein
VARRERQNSFRGPDSDRPSFVDVAASMTNGELTLPCVGDRLTSNCTPRLHRELRQWWSDLTTRIAPARPTTQPPRRERTRRQTNRRTRPTLRRRTQTFEMLPGSAIVSRRQTSISVPSQTVTALPSWPGNNVTLLGTRRLRRL